MKLVLEFCCISFFLPLTLLPELAVGEVFAFVLAPAQLNAGYQGGIYCSLSEREFQSSLG